MNRNILASLPTWLSRWFGYRSNPSPKCSDYIVGIWSFIGTFSGISILQGVFKQLQFLAKKKVPTIVPSYGASAVLIYGVIDGPLAQPRALFGGHFFGALAGIIITKLFQLLPTEERYEQVAWLAASLSCAVATVVMQVTHTVHPPAGATALLPAISQEIRDLGWYFIPVVLLSSALVFGVALINNNIQRRYPTFWFTSPKAAVSASTAAPLPVGSPAESSRITTRENNFLVEVKPSSSNINFVV